MRVYDTASRVIGLGVIYVPYREILPSIIGTCGMTQNNNVRYIWANIFEMSSTEQSAKLKRMTYA